MKTWLDLLANPDTIKAIYHDTVPSLNSVNIYEVIFHQDGPRVTLRFDLSIYPAAQPKKWESQGFNTVQVQLDIVGVTKSSFTGWETKNLVDIELSGLDNSVRLNASTGQFKVELHGASAFVQKVSGYCRNSSSEQ